ncbi:MAG: glycosyltransferase family 4 protein [Flavisolibacter sp.]
MIIAVNTRFLMKNNLEGIGYFIHETLKIITASHPEHQFYFLFDRPFDPSFVFASNVHPIVVSPPARHPFLWKYWYDLRIPIILKKIKADVFVSPDGFASLSTKIPQCLVVHDLGFLHHPDAYKKSHEVYMRHYMPKYLKKAKTIATVSQFSKEDIIKNYKTDPSRINVVYSAPKNIFHPVTFADQEATREKYTEGKAYFIYVGAIQPRKNLVNLLKAFSVFKKRQRSNMKLVLAGRLAWKHDAFVQSLKTYKYREDVVMTGYIPEDKLVNLIGSAYALVYPSLFEGFGVPVLEAMRCEVPALTSSASSMQEVGEDAALYFDSNDHDDIAEKLMLIYKDENLRKIIIEKGKDIALKYTWERTAGLLWNSITAASR